MPLFSRVFNCYLDIASGSNTRLLASKAGGAADAPVWEVKDIFTLALNFCTTSGVIGAGYNGIQIPGGDSLIVGIKPAANPRSTDFLANATGFVEVLTVDQYSYTATLSLDVAPLITALSTATGSLPVIVTVQERNPSNTGRLSFSFAATIVPAGILGTEGVPASGNPPYALPQNIVTYLPGITALTGGAPTNLDGITTLGGVAPKLVIIEVSPLDEWKLADSAPIVSSSVANPTVITTSKPHGLISGQGCIIGGHAGSTPAVAGAYTATVLDATRFTVPVNVTVAGTGGFVTPASNPSGGIVLPADFDTAANAVSWRSR